MAQLQGIAAQLRGRETNAWIVELAGILGFRTCHITSIERGSRMDIWTALQIAGLLLAVAGIVITFKPWDLD